MYHVEGQIGFSWDGHVLKLKTLMPGARIDKQLEPGADPKRIAFLQEVRNRDREVRDLTRRRRG